MGPMDYYETDFEAPMLEDTAAYYSRKASSWILEDSCPEYMLKVAFNLVYLLDSNCQGVWGRELQVSVLPLQSEECLKKEKDRVDHYLHSNSEQKLLEVSFIDHFH